ncbi:hypothetical protein EX30DRAFT_72567 [Ascodesmis nigricans]|uniref:Uncharacterized protein n=1 Tax=Ascodesmis nigricans TaxID=341454 RepID=A0A4S2MTU4_9PEZI|nr:hypothetical protein EX30DRAFT_72567 [Ascodesmis nigricans]
MGGSRSGFTSWGDRDRGSLRFEIRGLRGGDLDGDGDGNLDDDRRCFHVLARLPLESTRRIRQIDEGTNNSFFRFVFGLPISGFVATPQITSCECHCWCSWCSWCWICLSTLSYITIIHAPYIQLDTGKATATATYIHVHVHAKMVDEHARNP